jgi:hypothetical protein
MLPYGCRNGACGTCKGRILSGEVDYGAHQAATLTDDEKRKGLALFCVARPKTDLVIEVKEVRRAGDIQVRRLPCRIESIERAAPDVAIVRLKLPANERLQYLAGQYIDLLLKDGRRRSFSLRRRRTTTRCSSCTSATFRAASSPRSSSPSTRAARSCASKVRWGRSTCARIRTSR